MKFCTTCGRNFADDSEICPHDGTPLFYMGGDPGTSSADAEPQEEPPVEAVAAAETASESAEVAQAEPHDVASTEEPDSAPEEEPVDQTAEPSEPEQEEPAALDS
ncbi:MAG: hypothetical protein R3E66_16440, partial [bacterium]